MSARIQIRRPSNSDLEAIEALLRASGNFSDVEVTTAIELVQLSLEGGHGYQSIVAEGPSGQSLGYALFAPTALTAHTWDLYWIAVHPDAHGKGVGKALLKAVEEAVREAGGRILVIETSGRADYEKARRLYERGGYTRAACLVDFYKEGDDKLIYTRRLDRDAPAPSSPAPTTSGRLRPQPPAPAPAPTRAA